MRPGFCPGHLWMSCGAYFPQHTFVDVWDREGLRRALPEGDAAFAAFVDRDIIHTLTRLKWVQAPAVGVGHILSEEMIASPIVLTSARGVRARAIAEHVIGMAIALARQLPCVLAQQREHRWALDDDRGKRIDSHPAEAAGWALSVSGSIGLEVAQAASGFGMRVWGIRRRVDEPVPPFVERILPPDGLNDLLASSDVVVLSAPLTPETRQLIQCRDAGDHEARRVSHQYWPR